MPEYPSSGGGNAPPGSYSPIEGDDLADASVTLSPASAPQGEAVLPAATLTANRTLTLGTSGSPATGFTFTIIRKDATNKTYAVVNGGTNGGTMFTFSASPTTWQAAVFQYNGVDWVFLGLTVVV